MKIDSFAVLFMPVHETGLKRPDILSIVYQARKIHTYSHKTDVNVNYSNRLSLITRLCTKYI